MTEDRRRRPPEPGDLITLAKALGDNGVEYVVIGGAAMALHGFPRMTKDIDLFLPVDPANNARLLQALRSLPNSLAGLALLNPKYLDQGFSTAFEAEVPIDILYVAAGKRFDDLRPHVKRVDVDGVPVSTLDIDGMLISKATTRQSDVPDRIKLERLRNALLDAERKRRQDDLAALLADSSPTVRYFAEAAAAAMSSGTGTAPDWKRLEEQVLDFGNKHPTIDVRDLAEVLCQHSPGAVYPSRQETLRKQAVALHSARSKAKRAR